MGLANISDKILWDLANAVSKDPIIRSMPDAGQAPDDDGRFFNPDHIFRAMKRAEAR
jgi:hypothetical protein